MHNFIFVYFFETHNIVKWFSFNNKILKEKGKCLFAISKLIKITKSALEIDLCEDMCTIMAPTHLPSHTVPATILLMVLNSFRLNQCRCYLSEHSCPLQSLLWNYNTQCHVSPVCVTFVGCSRLQLPEVACINHFK